MTLDVSLDRKGTTPTDAATLILLRDSARGLELFSVERNKKSRFLGGAIVFPGGKLDDADMSPLWTDVATAPAVPHTPISRDSDHLRGLSVAACRESLEEAAILPVSGGTLSHVEALALRAQLGSAGSGISLADILRTRKLRMDLAALTSFSRWVTPIAEARRFDARFFLALAPEGQEGAHDESETMASFWATPGELLTRFEKREVSLAPPTHRTVEILASFTSAANAIRAARDACLMPICPDLVRQGDTLALVLPGDPEHPIKEARISGRSRYVLRNEQWLPEDAP